MRQAFNNEKVELCGACQGTGVDETGRKCHVCDGTGRVYKKCEGTLTVEPYKGQKVTKRT